MSVIEEKNTVDKEQSMKKMIDNNEAIDRKRSRRGENNHVKRSRRRSEKSYLGPDFVSGSRNLSSTTTTTTSSFGSLGSYNSPSTSGAGTPVPSGTPLQRSGDHAPSSEFNNPIANIGNSTLDMDGLEDFINQTSSFNSDLGREELPDEEEEIGEIEEYIAGSDRAYGAGTVLALYLKSAGNDFVAIAERVASDVTFAKGLSTLLNRVSTASDLSCDRAKAMSLAAISNASQAVALITDKVVIKRLSKFEFTTLLVEKVSWTSSGGVISVGGKPVLNLNTSPFTNTVIDVTPLVSYFSMDIEIHPNAPWLYYWACFNGYWSFAGDSVIYHLAALPIVSSHEKQSVYSIRATDRKLGIFDKISKCRSYFADFVTKCTPQSKDLFNFREGFIRSCNQVQCDKARNVYELALSEWYKGLEDKNMFSGKTGQSILTNLSSFIAANKGYRKVLGSFNGSAKVQVTPEFDYPSPIINHFPRRLRYNKVLQFLLKNNDALWSVDGQYQDLVQIGLLKINSQADYYRMQWINPASLTEEELGVVCNMKFDVVYFEQRHSSIVIMKRGTKYTFSSVMIASAMRIFIGECRYMSALLSGDIRYGSDTYWDTKSTSVTTKKNKPAVMCDFDSVASLLEGIGL